MHASPTAQDTRVGRVNYLGVNNFVNNFWT